MFRQMFVVATVGVTACSSPAADPKSPAALSVVESSKGADASSEASPEAAVAPESGPSADGSASCNVTSAPATTVVGMPCYPPSTMPAAGCLAPSSCTLCTFIDCHVNQGSPVLPPGPRTFFSCDCVNGAWNCSVFALDTGACIVDAAPEEG
jgi:hypothetical protein